MKRLPEARRAALSTVLAYVLMLLLLTLAVGVSMTLTFDKVCDTHTALLCIKLPLWWCD